MATVKKHVAGSGIRKGQWVTCNAKNECRLGGQHITEQTLNATRIWLDEKGIGKKVSEVTVKDVNDYLASTDNREVVTAGGLVYTKLTADEVEAHYADKLRDELTSEARAKYEEARDREPVKMKLTNYRFTKAQWDGLVKEANENGLKLKVVGKQQSEKFAGYPTIFKVDGLALDGPRGKVRELSEKMKSMSVNNPRSYSAGSGYIPADVWEGLTRVAQENNVTFEYRDIVAGEVGGFFSRDVVIGVEDLKFVGSSEGLEKMIRYYNKVSKL